MLSIIGERPKKMNEELEKKKAWLRRYIPAQRLEKIYRQEVERLRSEAEKMTQCISGMPGGGSSQDKLPRTVERIEEARQREAEQADECKRVYIEIGDSISALHNEQQQEVLVRKYIKDQSWICIAMHMNRSKKTVQRYHDKALSRLKIPEK